MQIHCKTFVPHAAAIQCEAFSHQGPNEALIADSQFPHSPSQRLSPTHAWLIHQTTTILHPPTLVDESWWRHTQMCACGTAGVGFGGDGCWRVWGGTCTRMHCAQNPYRAAHEHASAAPSIMVNTSNSISFLDSWSLDRHDSDSTWFLAGCLPLQLPHFFFIPYEVCLGGYGTCCQNRFPYILPFSAFCKLV